MVVEEKQTKIAPSVSIRALTFEGAALGPMIVMHEGDYMVWEQRTWTEEGPSGYSRLERGTSQGIAQRPQNAILRVFQPSRVNPTYKGRKRSVRGQ